MVLSEWLYFLKLWSNAILAIEKHTIKHFNSKLSFKIVFIYLLHALNLIATMSPPQQSSPQHENTALSESVFDGRKLNYKFFIMYKKYKIKRFHHKLTFKRVTFLLIIF